MHIIKSRKQLKTNHNFTIVIEKEDDMYVSLCPELDIASQGYSIEEAKANLKEAIELYYEFASENERFSIEQGINDIKNGFIISHDKVKNYYEKWL